MAGISISKTYTGSNKYTMRDNVATSDKGVSEDHTNQSVDISTNAANPEPNSNTTPEEMDLSLDTKPSTDSSSNEVTASDKNTSTNSTGTGAGGTTANTSTSAGTNSPTTSANASSGGNGGNSSTSTSSSAASIGNGDSAGKGGDSSTSISGPSGSEIKGGNQTVSTGGNSNTTSTSNASSGSNGTSFNPIGNNKDGDSDSSKSTSAPSSDIPAPTFTFKGDKVIITAVNSKGEIETNEMPLEEFIANLKKCGLTQKDIDRVINGEITLEDLYKEIENDPDSARRQKMLETAYLNALCPEYEDMGQLSDQLEADKAALKELIAQKKEIDSHEYECLLNLITALQNGYGSQSLDQPIAWQYTDENGDIQYTYTDPNQYGYNGVDSTVYTPMTYEQMYPDNEDFKKLKEITEADVGNIFTGYKSGNRWQDTPEQIDYLNDISKKYETERSTREKNLSKIQSEIDSTYARIQEEQAYYDYINHQIEYNMANIDPYIHNDDFAAKSEADPSKYQETLEKIEASCSANTSFSTYGLPQCPINDKGMIVDTIAAMINGDMSTSGIVSEGYTPYQISSGDALMNHYPRMIEVMTDDEKAVFNYIYNTKSKEEAYAYLDSIAEELDNRTVMKRQAKDAKWASEHPILASVASIFITPFEGMAAMAASLNSVAVQERIWRMDVYSSGNVFRNQVAADIAAFNPTLSFIYSTAMSMADSALLIGVGVLTGGTGLPLISAALMGSRAYVTTLNEALDRGLTDGQAVALAFTSAAVETAMESWSAGHLLNLESILGSQATALSAKVASQFTNPAAAAFASKGVYVFASALSQGLCEGEEELSTEILNYICDYFIAGDKSNYTQSMIKYTDLGYSEEEAHRLTMQEFRTQAFQAFLGGFVSGVCFGSFAGTNTTRVVSKGLANGIYDSYVSIDSGTAFAEALQLNDFEMQAVESAAKKIEAGKMDTLTNPAKALATIKNIGKKIMGTSTYNQQDIINAMTNKTITQDQAVLLLYGTRLQYAHYQLREALKSKIENFFFKHNNTNNNSSNYSSNAIGSNDATMITTTEQLTNDVQYAIAQWITKYQVSELEAFDQMAFAIQTRDYNAFTSFGNARNIMRQYSFEAIAEAYTDLYNDYCSRLALKIENVINAMSERHNYSIETTLQILSDYANGIRGINYITSHQNARSIISNLTLREIELGIQEYNTQRESIKVVVDAINAMKEKYSDMTYDECLIQLEEFIKTHNLNLITRNKGARDAIAAMDDHRLFQAVVKLRNLYNSSKTKVKANIQRIVTDLRNALNNSYRSNPTAITAFFDGLVEQVQVGRPSANTFVNQLINVFSYDHDLSIISIKENECYWSSYNNHMHLGKITVAIRDFGTMMHETGHLLFYKVLGERVPSDSVQIFESARRTVSYDRSEYERELASTSQRVSAEAQRIFNNNLIAQGITYQQYENNLIAIYSRQGAPQQLRNNLERMGVSQERINKIMANVRSVQEAVEQHKQAEMRAIKDRVYRTQYGDMCAISDIMDALFYGKPVDYYNRRIAVDYSHGSKYYRDSNNAQVSQFHEIIANYTQLRMSGNQESIRLLTRTFGVDFVSLLENTYQQMITRAPARGNGGPYYYSTNTANNSEASSNQETILSVVSDENFTAENLFRFLDENKILYNREEIEKALSNESLRKSGKIAQIIYSKIVKAKSITIDGQELKLKPEVAKKLTEFLSADNYKDYNILIEGIKALYTSPQLSSLSDKGKVMEKATLTLVTLFDLYKENAYTTEQILEDTKIHFRDQVIMKKLQELKDKLDPDDDITAAYDRLIADMTLLKDFITYDQIAAILESNPPALITSERAQEKQMFEAIKFIRETVVNGYIENIFVDNNIIVNVTEDLSKLNAEFELAYEGHIPLFKYLYDKSVQGNIDALEIQNTINDSIMKSRKERINAIIEKLHLEAYKDMIFEDFERFFPYRYSALEESNVLTLSIAKLIFKQDLNAETIQEYIEYHGTNLGELAETVLAANYDGDVLTEINNRILEGKLDRIQKAIPDISPAIAQELVKSLNIYESDAGIIEKAINLAIANNDLDLAKSLTTTNLQGLLGDYINDDVINSLDFNANHTYGELLRQTYEILVNQGISSDQIIRRMAENIQIPEGFYGDINQEEIVNNNYELIKHILTFDPEEGAQGGGHYNSILLEPFQLTDTNTENFVDTFIIYQDEKNQDQKAKKTMYPDSMSIQSIMDIGISAFKVGSIDESDIRGNGNFVFNYVLKQSEFGPLSNIESIGGMTINFIIKADGSSIATIYPSFLRKNKP